MSARRITIRKAERSDLDAVVTLYRQRDGRSYDRAVVAADVLGLDPARCAAMLAFDGDRPVGMSMYCHRMLRFRGSEHPAGYWTNLYVDPEYRKAMIYPRLPLTMFRAAAAEGVECVFSVIRRMESASVHHHMGCRDLGGIELRVKPLRPLRAVATRRGWSAVARAAAPADLAFDLASRVHARLSTPRVEVVELSWSAPELAELVSAREELVADFVHQEWTPTSAAERFSRCRDGASYSLIGARREGRLAAAAVFRLGEYFGIRAGLVMELYWRPLDEDVVPALLAALERRAFAARADVMLLLDGFRGGIAKRWTRAGYVRSNETYRLILWPNTWAPGHAEMLDASSWWFSFADHDAT